MSPCSTANSNPTAAFRVPFLSPYTHPERASGRAPLNSLKVGSLEGNSLVNQDVVSKCGPGAPRLRRAQGAQVASGSSPSMPSNPVSPGGSGCSDAQRPAGVHAGGEAEPRLAPKPRCSKPAARSWAHLSCCFTGAGERRSTRGPGARWFLKSNDISQTAHCYGRRWPFGIWGT